MKSITKTEIAGLISAGALAAIVIASGLHPAFAGGYVAPVVQPQISATVERPAFSWTGFYAGGTIGKQSVDLTKDEQAKVGWTGGGFPIYEAFKTKIDDSDTTYGVFAGYRHQFGNRVVAGAEASYTRTGKLFTEDWQDSQTVETWAVEGQLGYAIGRALPYAAAGYAQVEGEDALSVSLGLDYAITDRVIIGAKYTRFDIGEVKGIDSIKGFEADSDLVSLRAAIKF